jgi:hypothetical protein
LGPAGLCYHRRQRPLARHRSQRRRTGGAVSAEERGGEVRQVRRPAADADALLHTIATPGRHLCCSAELRARLPKGQGLRFVM